ncbi:MAG: hypothetical protein A3E82_06580 [Gammaproteobacteria bacterium RIFCSPHIGHO2_12_FULL_38_11]|nr:MAG: hypothetical protein A3E82_06580 [Gammaproteobacteria bacterium RIFCSPHIGHO2_12_FULL_38_11]
MQKFLNQQGRRQIGKSSLLSEERLLSTQRNQQQPRVYNITDLTQEEREAFFRSPNYIPGIMIVDDNPQPLWQNQFSFLPRPPRRTYMDISPNSGLSDDEDTSYRQN